MQGNTHNVPKFASQAVRSRMQLTLHATRLTPYGASPLAPALPFWPLKTTRAPSRHYNDARVYGDPTMAKFDNGCTPPLEGLIVAIPPSPAVDILHTHLYKGDVELPQHVCTASCLSGN